MAPAPSRGVATLAIVSSAACWGLATVMSKGALSVLPPLSLVTVQLITSVTLTWVLILAINGIPRIDRAARRAALNGILEPGLSYVVGMQGLALTSASSASLIGATEPVLSLGLLFLLFRVKSKQRDILAIILAVIGAGCVTVTGGEDGTGQFAGDMLIVGGTLFAALYVVLSSRLSEHAPPLLMAGMQQGLGLIVVAIAAAVALSLGWEQISRWPTMGEWLFIIASGLVQHAIAFWLYLIAVRTIPVQQASLFLTLVPVFGVGGAVLFLGEPLSTMQVAGSALILVALLVASVDRKKILKRDRPPL